MILLILLLKLFVTYRMMNKNNPKSMNKNMKIDGIITKNGTFKPYTYSVRNIIIIANRTFRENLKTNTLN